MKTKRGITTVALAALASAAGFGAAHAQTAAPVLTTNWNGAPESREGEQRFKIRGRLQYDILSSDFDVGADDGTRSYVRRAFLGASGRLTDHWRYKLDFVLNPGANDTTTTLTTTTIADCNAALAGNQPCVGTVSASTSGGAEDVGVDDAYLEYAGDTFSFVIGEHNVASPLEDRTSSLDTPFNERSSYINAFGFGRAAGFGYVTNGTKWTFSAALQGDSLNNQDASFVADEAIAYTGRFTFTPIYETSPEGVTLVHLGAVARYRNIADDAGTRYRTRPLNGRGARALDFGGSTLGESDTTYVIEAAAQWNNFGATVEYSRLTGEETGPAGGSEFEFSGYFVDLFWSPTGESRNYRANTASWGAVAPRHPVTEGGMGHWMVSARYDFLDLSDSDGAPATRGEQSAYALGLDWVPVDHVKFKLNYAMSDIDQFSGADETAQIVSLRTQFDF